MELSDANQNTENMFESMTNDGEKVLAVYNVALKNDFYTNFGFSKTQKDDTWANHLRLAADKAYNDGNFSESLTLYNQSLCFSTENCKNVGLVYAKRSAVYQELGYFKTCLKNIDLALEYKCSDEVKDQLIKRQEKCVELMNNQSGNQRREDDQIEIKLSYEVNDKIPFMVEGIKCVYDKNFGRGLVATRDFKPGDILIHETPMIKALDLDCCYEYCFWCLKGNLMSLLPCKESTKIMFCSDECYNENLIHGLSSEAKVVESVDMDGFDFYRLILKFLTTFDDFNELQQILDTASTESSAVFDLDYNQAPVKDRIKAYFSLASHRDKPSKDYYELAARMFYLMTEHTDLNQKLVSERQKITVMDAIYRLCRILSVNCFPFKALDSNGEPIGKGTGAALIASMINHSCAPNSFIFGENTVSIAAERPIKAGDQITISYYRAHVNCPLTKRQAHLKDIFYFDCRCIACENDYLMASQMLPKEIFELEPIIELISAVENSNMIESSYVGRVKTLLKMFIAIFEKSDKHYPCYELCISLKELRYCVYRLYHSIPLQPQFHSELKTIQ